MKIVNPADSKAWIYVFSPGFVEIAPGEEHDFPLSERVAWLEFDKQMPALELFYYTTGEIDERSLFGGADFRTEFQGVHGLEAGLDSASGEARYQGALPDASEGIPSSMRNPNEP